LKGLHDTCSFLVTVCDEDAVTEFTQQVHEIDERWQEVQRALVDQSVLKYSAGVQCVSRWCNSVEMELSRYISANYQDLSAQHNLLEVSL